MGSFCYNEYVNTEVLFSMQYHRANKKLSIARYNQDNSICLSFVSLRRQFCPQLLFGKKGCRILDYYTKRDYQNIYRIEDSILNEVIDRVTIWVDRNGDYAFDYLWFISDKRFDSIYQHLPQLKQFGDINYLIIKHE